MNGSNTAGSNMGWISSINGAVMKVKGLEDTARLHDLVRIKRHNIIGEIIQIHSEDITVLCFERTDNLKLKEEVENLKEPLSMELGPGLLGQIFDGVQRPLKEAFEVSNRSGFLERGLELPSLSREKKWHFEPLKQENDSVSSGDIIGVVQETSSIKHKILVPPNNEGKIVKIVSEGDYTVIDEIFELESEDSKKTFTMLQKWPVTNSRPYYSRDNPYKPLYTGMRVIDLLFPIAKGGTVAVPGGFGTGKTVIQQCLAKSSNADIIIFVGCGERGNEIADVLKQFADILDPKTQRPLLERIVLIANTSNMPVSAREASIFSGITIAEYYRDMGYDVALLADSTSRWAESLREISGLLEEMPAEEGYPAYLPSKLSGFYERAGTINTLGKDPSGKRLKGSLSIIGSVSPPSGDFSEPVTATTKRFVQAFWALDANLAYSKHYPAINWLDSYSNYPEYISDWWYERDIDWPELEADWVEVRKEFNDILSKENELKNIKQLVGEENLPESQQLIIFIGKIIREGFLMQNAFDEIDNYTGIKKLLGQAKIILLLYRESKELLKSGFITEDIKNQPFIQDILKIGTSIPNDDLDKLDELKDRMLDQIESLKLSFSITERK